MNNTKSLNETFEILFNTKKDADITFVVHGKELQAHKLILTSRSSVFDAMINSNLKTEDGKHLINDPEITFEDFENCLRFLYTDDCIVTDENVEKLMHLSNFYNVDCVRCIKKRMYCSTILKYAEIGLLYSETSSLLDVCLTEIPKQFTACNPFVYLTKEDEYKLISPELALKIVEKCVRNHTFTEEDLFHQIVSWARNKDKNKDANLQTVLKPLMPYFKLEMLKPLTLETIVRENNLVDDATLANALSKAVTAEAKKRAQRESPAYSPCPSSSYSSRYPTFSPCPPSLYSSGYPSYSPC